MASVNRNITDADLTKTVAVPSAGNTAATASIDFGFAAPFPLTEQVDVLVSLPAQATLADNKTITVTLQDSEDNNSFATLAGLSTLVQTGANSAGAAAATLRVKLPPGVHRYIKASVATASSSGTVSGNASLQVLL